MKAINILTCIAYPAMLLVGAHTAYGTFSRGVSFFVGRSSSGEVQYLGDSVNTNFTPLVLVSLLAAVSTSLSILALQSRTPRSNLKNRWLARAAIAFVWATPFGYGALAPGDKSKALQLAGVEYLPGLFGAIVLSVVTSSVLYLWFDSRRHEEPGDD